MIASGKNKKKETKLHQKPVLVCRKSNRDELRQDEVRGQKQANCIVHPSCGLPNYIDV